MPSYQSGSRARSSASGVAQVEERQLAVAVGHRRVLQRDPLDRRRSSARSRSKTYGTGSTMTPASRRSRMNGLRWSCCSPSLAPISTKRGPGYAVGERAQQPRARHQPALEPPVAQALAAGPSWLARDQCEHQGVHLAGSRRLEPVDHGDQRLQHERQQRAQRPRQPSSRTRPGRAGARWRARPMMPSKRTISKPAVRTARSQPRARPAPVVDRVGVVDHHPVGGQQQPPAGPQHAEALGQVELGVLDVLEHLGRQHGVERVGGARAACRRARSRTSASGLPGRSAATKSAPAGNRSPVGRVGAAVVEHAAAGAAPGARRPAPRRPAGSARAM